MFDAELAGEECLLQLVHFVLTLLDTHIEAAAYLFEVCRPFHCSIRYDETAILSGAVGVAMAW